MQKRGEKKGEKGPICACPIAKQSNNTPRERNGVSKRGEEKQSEKGNAKGDNGKKQMTKLSN